MEIALPLGVQNVVAGEQNLCHSVVVFAEQFVVSIHKLALPYGGGSLLGGHVLGPL